MRDHIRDYIGDATTGAPEVWVYHRAAAEVPTLGEIRRAMADIAAIFEKPAGFSADTRDRSFARKERFVAALRSAVSVPLVERLEHRPRYSLDGFRWGTQEGGLDLARAILTVELGGDPRTTAYHAFAQDIVDVLPRYAFHLPGEQVQHWFEKWPEFAIPLVPRPDEPEPDFGVGPAHAVTDLDPATGSSPVLDEPTASALVGACEAAWHAIKEQHPELPEAVIILGSGVERGRLVKLGHWWAGRWLADGQVRGEVLLAGEALHLSAKEVFEVLLHEAAHGLNATRGVKDTSRGGRYHNQRFAETAREVGLKVRAMPPYGLASTEVLPDTVDRYQPAIARLADAMRIARQLGRTVQLGDGKEAGSAEGDAEAGERERRSAAVAAMCGCGRRMRMAPTVFEKGDVVCAPCGSAFRDVAQPRQPSHEAEMERGRPSADSFLQRRRAALEAEATGDLDPPQRAALHAQLARLDAAIAAANGVPGLTPLIERSRRLHQFEGVEPTDVDLTDDQLAGMIELQNLRPNSSEVDLLSDWYRRVGRFDEQPMPSEPGVDPRRLVALARALLKLDGALRGPTLPFGDMGIQAGDRVVATAAVDSIDLPAGVYGTVRSVDNGKEVVEVEFATVGRLTTAPAWLHAAGVRHDYVATADHYVELRDGETPEFDEADLEAARLTPELGW